MSTVPRYFFSIDPGAEAAFAFWDKHKPAPLQVFMFQPFRRASWETRVKQTCDALQRAAQRTIEMHVGTQYEIGSYIEYPMIMQSPGGTASSRRGDLVKLAIAAGQLARTFSGPPLTEPVRWVEIGMWKGQMSKHATLMRVQRKMGENYRPFRSHEIDAVGIGLYVLGRF